MSFIKEHPNYSSYYSSDFYVNKFPSDMKEALEGFMLKIADNDCRKLKGLIHIIATIVNTGITQNYSWDYLLKDLGNSLNVLLSSKFENFFDFIEMLYNETELSKDDINTFLENNRIGYELLCTVEGVWKLKEDCGNKVIQRAEKIIQYISSKQLCMQTIEHLKQIINNLNIGTGRAMKDSLRDALSALESIMRDLTKTKDIREATKKLKSLKIAPDFLISDGLSIWDKLQQKYPDIRHGNPKITSVDKATVNYYLNKILIYIEYLSILDLEL